MQEKMGNNSDTASVIITVQDYDTLNPYFSQSVYKGKISENQVKAFHWLLQSRQVIPVHGAFLARILPPGAAYDGEQLCFVLTGDLWGVQ